MNEVVHGLWQEGGRLLTLDLAPHGHHFEFEESRTVQGKKYRVLDPQRSKLGAAVTKGLRQTGIKPGSIVLYLGASHGYTPSFVSDIVGKTGFLFCIDSSPRVVRDLVQLCEGRENMAPLLEDARNPEAYKKILPAVDIVYQDIAQRDQVTIFVRNCEAFLKQGGFGLLAIKSRSIDVARQPKDIFRAIRMEFEHGKLKEKFVIVDYRELAPFEKDHAFFVVKRR